MIYDVKIEHENLKCRVQQSTPSTFLWAKTFLESFYTKNTCKLKCIKCIISLLNFIYFIAILHVRYFTAQQYNTYSTEFLLHEIRYFPKNCIFNAMRKVSLKWKSQKHSIWRQGKVARGFLSESIFRKPPFAPSKKRLWRRFCHLVTPPHEVAFVHTCLWYNGGGVIQT